MKPHIREPGQGKVSLDEKSARKIAAGRIADYAQMVLDHSGKPLPQKRMAWLRELEARIRNRFGAGVLFISKDKRGLLCFVLCPYKFERVDSLEIVFLLYHFGKASQGDTIAQFSGHAVARLMERIRNVDPIVAVSGEFLQWTHAPLFKEYTGLHHDFLLLPTKTGYFMGKWDGEQFKYVMQTWLPDRLLNDSEQAALAKLRDEGQLGYCEKLSELC